MSDEYGGFFPALYLVIAAFRCLSPGHWLFPTELARLRTQPDGGLAVPLECIFQPSEINYFNSDVTTIPPLIHTWSLGVEEQFYVGISAAAVGDGAMAAADSNIPGS